VISKRAYAKHRQSRGLSGGTPKAVRAAIASGRLAASLTADGTIRDAATADQEWEASTHADRVPLAGPTSPSSRAGAATSIALYDEALDRRITALQLFRERDAISLLVTALASVVLNGSADRRTAAAVRKRVAAQLRAVAEAHGADAADIADAESHFELAVAIVLLLGDER